MAKVLRAAVEGKFSRKKKIKLVEEVARRIMNLLPWDREVRITFKNDSSNFATITPEQHYFRASINVDLDRHTDREELARSVVHEFMHMLVEPLDRYALRLAKASQDPKVHKKTVGDLVETCTSALEQTFFELICPEYTEGE